LPNPAVLEIKAAPRAPPLARRVGDPGRPESQHRAPVVAIAKRAAGVVGDLPIW
jgi:hypothetical protein